jgi:hypothetical protein
VKAFGTRTRGAFAAVLSVALISSGALLAAPAAYAETEAPTSAAASAESVASADGAENAADAPEAPAAPVEAPAAEVPAPEEDAKGAEEKAAPEEPAEAEDSDEDAADDLAAKSDDAGAAVTSGQEQLPKKQTRASWSPSISVYLNGTKLEAGDTVYKDDELVVRGTDFDPLSHPRPATPNRPPLTAGDPTGNYVVFGNFSSVWKPSVTGTASSDRKVADQRWAMTDATFNNIASRYVGAVVDQRVVLDEEGSFEARLTAKAVDATPGSYGVFTYVAGGGANDSLQELELRLDYVDTVRPTPNPGASLEVFLADGTTPYLNQELKEGDKLVVKGRGYDPFANVGGQGQPIPADKVQGTFVVFGHFAEKWKPSDGVKSDKRKHSTSARGWLLAEETMNSDPVYEAARSQWVELDASNGSFEWEVTLTEPDSVLEDGRWGIYTYAGGVNTQNAEQELESILNFKAKDRDETEAPEVSEGGLKWGIFDRFRNYVESNSDGKVSLLGAATREGNIFGFKQIAGGEWDQETEKGEIRFSGGIGFYAHGGGLNLTIEDPILKVDDSGAVLTARFDHGPQMVFADVDLSKAERTVGDDGAITWSGAETVLREEAVDSFLGFYPAGESFDPLSFTVGSSAIVDPTDPKEPITPVKPKPKPVPAPAPKAPGAGSLTWGVSSDYHAYTTDPQRPAKGQVRTNGVGGGPGGYVFPQATGGSWDSKTRTGSIRYSGTVTFWGHGGAMVETFANPVLSVHSPLAGSLSVNGATYPLNLMSAGFTENSDGSVTWSNVPVSGTISGSGAGGGGAFAADNLTFTIGSASGANYGSTVTGGSSAARTPAATPPAAQGLTVVTDAKKLVAGGEIEITASGFEPNETDILVVLYSEPTVLDTRAKADANGVVRWIGLLPEGLTGTHTITLQGSINVGQVITIAAADAQTRGSAEVTVAEVAETAGLAPAATDAGSAAWMWWGSALALLLIAGVTTGLVVAQRRKAEAPTSL